MLLGLKILPNGDALAEWVDLATGVVTVELLAGYALYLN